MVELNEDRQSVAVPQISLSAMMYLLPRREMAVASPAAGQALPDSFNQAPSQRDGAFLSYEKLYDISYSFLQSIF
jgi:hypothetical protein